MKRLVHLLLLALLVSCRSHKEVQKDVAVSVDSVAHSASHRTTASLDSVVHRLSFSFDTLEVCMERQFADTTQTIRLKAVKGQVKSHRKEESLAAEHHERLDTLAYKLASSDKSAEHSATTRIYDPPNGTVTIIVALLILAGLAYFIFRKKL